MTVTDSNLVPTTKAAKAVGVSRTTLLNMLESGRVSCEYATDGGHRRWSVEKLRKQLGIPTPPKGEDQHEASD